MRGTVQRTLAGAPFHPQTMRTLRLGKPSMCISITSPRTTGPTFSGVPE